MKTKPFFLERLSFTSTWFPRAVRGRRVGCSLIAFIVIGLGQALATPPSLQWFNNVQGVLFSLDSQTNIYVNSLGPIVKLDAAGVILQSNAICPISARAQRDADGNFYFADTYSPPRDFGGVTLTSGYLFVAKYSAAGSLIWANTLGPGFANSIAMTDFRVEPGGTAYAGYYYCLGSTCSSANKLVAALNPSGTTLWATNLGGGIIQTLSHSVRLGVATSSNVCVLGYDSANGGWAINFTRVGAESQLIATSSQPTSGNYSQRAARPIRNSKGEIYSVESALLTKRSPAGDVIWTVHLGNNNSWTVCEDQFDGVHIADGTGNLRRFDYDGNQAWSLNTASSPVEEMLIDAGGNRFFSTVNRYVGKLGPEFVTAPSITVSPQGLTTFSGSNVVLTLSATASGPVRYYWYRDGSFVAGGTNATLMLPAASSTQSGSYTVIVSNFLNSVTSSPAVVRIKSVQFFIGSQMLTNGTYNFINPPTLTILSAFTNGSRFYTTDGLPPSFASTFYTDPFVISNNATIRALGYSADFNQSEEADPVELVFPPKHSLTATLLGPGSVVLNPPGGLYQTSTVVSVTATPSPGWTFLYWAGDAAGVSPSINLTMDQNKSVQAVFGSSLATTTAGGGQVLTYPSGVNYPYGTVLRLTAVPDSGKYFGVWGNAASGNVNPLYFSLTNPSPTVSSFFVAVPSGQAALTVLINGPGSVTVDPPGNIFGTNQTISLTASPLAGQGFTGWAGDASGTSSQLLVPMTQSRVISANFTNWPVLIVSGQSLTPQGFQFKLVSGPGLAYEVQSSSNLSAWSSLGPVTNVSGEMLFLDPAATNNSRRFYKATPWP